MEWRSRQLVLTAYVMCLACAGHWSPCIKRKDLQHACCKVVSQFKSDSITNELKYCYHSLALQSRTELLARMFRVQHPLLSIWTEEKLLLFCLQFYYFYYYYYYYYSDWLRAGRPRGRSSRPGGWKIFTSPIVQTGSGVHPTSYTMGTRGSFPRVKRPGREADHSPPTSAEVNKIWIYTSTAPYVFME
jgi:hypothetical protein